MLSSGLGEDQQSPVQHSVRTQSLTPQQQQQKIPRVPLRGPEILRVPLQPMPPPLVIHPPPPPPPRLPLLFPQAAAAAAASGSPLPTPAKSVVFSQFMGMLDLVAAALAAEGIPYVRLDGKSTAAARTAAIRAFAGELATLHPLHAMSSAESPLLCP